MLHRGLHVFSLKRYCVTVNDLDLVYPPIRKNLGKCDAQTR